MASLEFEPLYHPHSAPTEAINRDLQPEAALPLGAACLIPRSQLRSGLQGPLFLPYGSRTNVAGPLQWFRFTVAAILDGFSRRLLCLRVYRRTPRARDMAALVRRMAKQFGKPRFVITDHGTQFRRQFCTAMGKTGITCVHARVRAPYLNGKIERAFRTFRVWWRLVLTGLTQRGIQRRLDDFRSWLNEHRPHSALQGRTPQEAWQGHVLPKPAPVRARDHLQPQIEIRRRHFHGDPRLPVVEISLRLAA